MAQAQRILVKIIIPLLRSYRYLLSPMWSCCRFYPSCSEYAEQAITRHGIGHGSLLTIKRLLRCHPGCQGGYDPLPKQ